MAMTTGVVCSLPEFDLAANRTASATGQVEARGAFPSRKARGLASMPLSRRLNGRECCAPQREAPRLHRPIRMHRANMLVCLCDGALCFPSIRQTLLAEVPGATPPSLLYFATVPVVFPSFYVFTTHRRTRVCAAVQVAPILLIPPRNSRSRMETAHRRERAASIQPQVGISRVLV